MKNDTLQVETDIHIALMKHVRTGSGGALYYEVGGGESKLDTIYHLSYTAFIQ